MTASLVCVIVFALIYSERRSLRLPGTKLVTVTPGIWFPKQYLLTQLKKKKKNPL